MAEEADGEAPASRPRDIVATHLSQHPELASKLMDLDDKDFDALEKAFQQLFGQPTFA